MLFNISMPNQDVLKLLDDFSDVVITQRFRDGDYAMEVPEPIIEQVTEFVQQRGFTIEPVTKARD